MTDKLWTLFCRIYYKILCCEMQWGNIDTSSTLYIYLAIKITHENNFLRLKKGAYSPFIVVNLILDQWMSTLSNQCRHGIWQKIWLGKCNFKLRALTVTERYWFQCLVNLYKKQGQKFPPRIKIPTKIEHAYRSQYLSMGVHWGIKKKKQNGFLEK